MNGARIACAILAIAIASDQAARADDGAPIRDALAAERPGAALALCEARELTAMPRDIRVMCGQAALRVGDQLRGAGLGALARERWQQALAFDPALTDDPLVLGRLVDATPTPPRNNDQIIPDDTTVPPQPQPSHTGRRTAAARAIASGEVDLSAPSDPPAPPGPRAERHLSISIGAGYTDGMLGFALGWLSGERLWMELATGLVFPTVDARLRFLVLREEVTPFIGFGIIVPFGSNDRVGLGLSGVEAIYELGDAFHLDIGITWAAVEGLEVLAGVTFVTPFDSTHPDTVTFFPQFFGAAAWIF